MLTKAQARDFHGRFREIVGDPLNLLIERHPEAGMVSDDHVTLHNGNRVHFSGPHAYYEDFSAILVINRGVHEPLEELVFQEVMRAMPQAPVMLELGAYWAHYSMWMKRMRPEARLFMVEPDAKNAEVGRANLRLNGMTGDYSEAFVGKGHFELDPWFKTTGVARLDMLHSDIQGFETEMLQGARRALAEQRVDYWFISTHSQEIHAEVTEVLTAAGYRIDASADFDHDTTSFDGFILGTHPGKPNPFPGPAPMGREAIARAAPKELIESVAARLR